MAVVGAEHFYPAFIAWFCLFQLRTAHATAADAGPGWGLSPGSATPKIWVFTKHN